MKIDAALRNAQRDAVPLVLARVDEDGAEGRGGVGRTLRRQDRAQAERRQARIGIGEAKCRRRDALSIPSREHTERVGGVADNEARAELVEVELIKERLGDSARHVEEEAAAILRRRFDDDEIGDDLALR